MVACVSGLLRTSVFNFTSSLRAAELEPLSLAIGVKLMASAQLLDAASEVLEVHAGPALECAMGKSAG